MEFLQRATIAVALLSIAPSCGATDQTAKDAGKVDTFVVADLVDALSSIRRADAGPHGVADAADAARHKEDVDGGAAVVADVVDASSRAQDVDAGSVVFADVVDVASPDAASLDVDADAGSVVFADVVDVAALEEVVDAGPVFTDVVDVASLDDTDVGFPDIVDSGSEDSFFPCIPSCDCEECGDDGCGGSCGECDDGNDCTTDTCVGGLCLSESALDPGCCAVEADCDDADICTKEACFDHQCLYYPIHGCCNTKADCGELGICWDTTCDPWTKQCKFEKKSIIAQKVWGIACCDNDEDCGPDGIWEEDTNLDGLPGPDDPTTFDFCDYGLCNHPPKSGPCGCSTHLDCYNAEDCSIDYCLECHCRHIWIQWQCCSNDAQCPSDGNACTDDKCDLETGTCKYIKKVCCCASDDGCDDGDYCTIDVCMPDLCCSHELDKDCCHEDEECDDCDPETMDVCMNYVCKHGPVPK